MGPTPNPEGIHDLEHACVMFMREVEGYVKAFVAKQPTSEHVRRSHLPHHPKCRQCISGRLQHRAKRRLKS